MLRNPRYAVRGVTQHAPIPANRFNAIPSTRPHSNAVPSTRPHLNAHRTPCPARAASAHHALLRCPARQYARGSFHGTLDLRSARYDATASPLPRTSVRKGVLSRDPGRQVYLVRRHRTEILAAFVNRTLTAYPRASPPRRLVAPLPLPPLAPRRLLRLGSTLLHPPLSLFEYMVMFPSGPSSVSLRCSLRLCCPFLLFHLIRIVWWRGF